MFKPGIIQYNSKQILSWDLGAIGPLSSINLLIQVNGITIVNENGSNTGNFFVNVGDSVYVETSGNNSGGNVETTLEVIEDITDIYYDTFSNADFASRDFSFTVNNFPYFVISRIMGS